MTRKIVLDYWQKPIPPRGFDWCATFDGYEPGEPFGYGATESDAVAALLDAAENSGFLDYLKERE